MTYQIKKEKTLRGIHSHIILWKILRNNEQLSPLNFEEHQVIDEFQLQFLCRQLKVIISLEDYHFECDFNHFRSQGYLVLRYESFLILDFPEIVVEDIITETQRVMQR